MVRRKRDQKDDHCPEENREHRDRVNQNRKEEKKISFLVMWPKIVGNIFPIKAYL